jgi:hypothetical protein
MQGSVAQLLVGDLHLLLIEAADYIPKWLDHSRHGSLDSIARHRVWIHDGQMHIVPRKNSTGRGAHSAGTSSAGKVIGSFDPGKLDLDTAVAAVRSEAVATLAPFRVQEHLKRSRFSHFPEQAGHSGHRLRVWLPVHCASMLVQGDKIADAAARAFVDRESSSMQAAVHEPGVWPQIQPGPSQDEPDPGQELVRCTVRLRWERAHMLDSSEAVVPKGWKCPEEAPTRAARIGMKLALGLHMHALALRVNLMEGRGPEGGVALDDLPEWHSYLMNLTNNGYFQGKLPGSQAHCAAMLDAQRSFEVTPAFHCGGARALARVTHLAEVAAAPVNMTAICASRKLPEDDLTCAFSSALISKQLQPSWQLSLPSMLGHLVRCSLKGFSV